MAMFFFVLAAANLIFNIFNNDWAKEIYATVIVLLLFSLNNCFLIWWQSRNLRNNPSSFWSFLVDTYLMARFNELKIFFWISALIISLFAVVFYTGYTQFALLGWILAIFLVLYNFKKIFYSFLPPEWFLHDINTGYVFGSIFIAWGIAYLMSQKLGVHFVLPMLLVLIFWLMGMYFIRGNTRFFVSGCSLVCADIVWQIIRLIRNNATIQPPFLLTAIVLIIAMIVGLVWLIRKPGILPIIYLTLFQLFRFSNFSEQAINNLMLEQLTAIETQAYIFYLVCWMFVAPLILWMGLRMDVKPTIPPLASRSRDSIERLSRESNHGGGKH